MQKQSQTHLMHHIALGKRKRLAHKPSQPLTHRVVEPLNMTCLTRPFTRRPMLRGRQHVGICFPKVGVQQALLVRFGNATPQQTTQVLTATANGIGDDLPCPTTLRQPDPAFVLPVMDKGPQLIEFEHVFRQNRSQRCLERRQRFGFFLAS